jgi:hypothetical protein
MVRCTSWGVFLRVYVVLYLNMHDLIANPSSGLHSALQRGNSGYDCARAIHANPSELATYSYTPATTN